jgi:hypothetical protein
MNLNYLIDPNMQFQDRNGVNNVAGFLRVYYEGTDDRATTYKDFIGTLNPADIPLDNNGRAVVIADSEKEYRVEVYSASGAMLWTQHPLFVQGGGGGGGREWISIDSPDDSINVDPHVDPDTGALVYSISTNIVEMTTDEVTEVINDFNY